MVRHPSKELLIFRQARRRVVSRDILETMYRFMNMVQIRLIEALSVSGIYTP